MDETERHLGPGELAEAAGVTVRTLRHYEEIGLLKPAERSWGGHRRYGSNEVQSLYRILALRRLGFPLAEIAHLIDSDSGSLFEATRWQLRQVDDQVTGLERLRDRLVVVLDSLERSKAPSTNELIDAMEAMTVPVKLTRI